VVVGADWRGQLKITGHTASLGLDGRAAASSNEAATDKGAT
jgi:hypothetical protein